MCKECSQVVSMTTVVCWCAPPITNWLSLRLLNNKGLLFFHGMLSFYITGIHSIIRLSLGDSLVQGVQLLSSIFISLLIRIVEHLSFSTFPNYSLGGKVYINKKLVNNLQLNIIIIKLVTLYIMILKSL